MDFLRRFWSIKGGSILLMGLAFFIVTFGQPAWLPWLGLVAAVCGYALFWKGSFAFKSMWVRFALSSVWFTAVEFTQLSWMSADDYQGRYIWFVWSLLSLICGLQFGVLSFFVRPNPKITLLRTLTVPSIWVLMEWSRLAITAGFTWNPVGIALTGYPLTTQLVSVVGVYGLSFFVMLANILFLQLCTAPFQKRRWAYAAVAAGVPYLFGAVHLFVHSQKMESDERSPLAVVLVQTGLGPLEKGSVQLRHPRAVPPFEQWRRILALLSDHKERRIDLVVLPEAAVPLEAAFPFYDSRVAEHLVRRYCSDRRPSYQPPPFVSNTFFCQAIADSLKADVIVGMDTRDDGQGSVYNAALHFRPGQEEIQRYAKRVLFPFAEEIPFQWMRAIAARYGITDSFTRGQAAKIFPSQVPIGTTICYEETFGNLVRENRNLGAEVLVNLSADGWYPHSRLPLQHFTHGRLRAIENGIPLLRSCHTGITAAVDSLGRTLAQVGDKHGGPEELSQALWVEVPRYNYRTIYSACGDGLIVGSSLLLVLLFFRTRVVKAAS